MVAEPKKRRDPLNVGGEDAATPSSLEALAMPSGEASISGEISESLDPYDDPASAFYNPDGNPDNDSDNFDVNGNLPPRYPSDEILAETSEGLPSTGKLGAVESSDLATESNGLAEADTDGMQAVSGKKESHYGVLLVSQQYGAEGTAMGLSIDLDGVKGPSVYILSAHNLNDAMERFAQGNEVAYKVVIADGAAPIIPTLKMQEMLEKDTVVYRIVPNRDHDIGQRYAMVEEGIGTGAYSLIPYADTLEMRAAVNLGLFPSHEEAQVQEPEAETDQERQLTYVLAQDIPLNGDDSVDGVVKILHPLPEDAKLPDLVRHVMEYHLQQQGPAE